VHRRDPLGVIDPLSPREAEIAVLLREEGLTQRQVAERLAISPRTVEAHVAQIRRKTGSATTATALARAASRTRRAAASG
jgi:DNA-binding CsgD family transcriptional regulator